jgi:hypothetical protein
MSEEAPAEAPEPVEHEPTEETRALVRELAKERSQRRTAKALSIGVAEFMQHYADDWEVGREEAKEGLLGKLLAQGLAGNANAAVKYMHMTGMVPPQRVEHVGKDGGPIEHVDLSLLNDDQLRDYGRLSAIAAGLDPDVIIFEQQLPSP